MRIKNITLHNFGSYRGNNQFHFEVNRSGKRVVVIGGKNGTGKTTLFTAIQVCLYGNFAFGFKTSGKRYLAEIYDLINDQVRIEKNASAFVEIDFEQVDNTDLFNYTIRRTWTWPQNTICESLAVWKNGCRLEEEELLNFQNYLIHLIPPDLLKLYFFDNKEKPPAWNFQVGGFVNYHLLCSILKRSATAKPALKRVYIDSHESVSPEVDGATNICRIIGKLFRSGQSMSG